MKKTLFRVLVVLSLIVSNGTCSTSQAQGTAFTYQGQLYAGTNLASGKYDFQFALSNAPSGGLQIGPTLTSLGVGVRNGVFITTLDFGPVYVGQSNWLAIAVRTNGASSFTPLSPLQPITPTPYAVFAESANATNLVGAVPPASLAGVALRAGGNNFTGNQTVTGGNVGIGTTATSMSTLTVAGNGLALNDTIRPSWMLSAEVGQTAGRGADGNSAFFYNSDGSSFWRGVMVGDNGTAGIIEAGSQLSNGAWVNRNLALQTEGGNVGIGTNGPGAALDVRITSAAGTGSLISEFGSPVNPRFEFFDEIVSSNLGPRLFFNAGNVGQIAGSGNIALMPGGNAGIGTTTPAKLLDVSGTVAALGVNASVDPSVLLRLENTSKDGSVSTPDVVGIGFGRNATAQAIVGGTYGNDYLAFYTGGALTTPKLLIGDNGYVGIGTTSPGSALQVNGTVTATGFSGDGSGLTNLNFSATQLISAGNNNGGSDNFYLGPVSGTTTTTGSGNTACGYNSFLANTDGNGNTATGSAALRANTDGSYNTADGRYALYSNTDGSYNTAGGFEALANNLGGGHNTADGSDALYNNVAGNFNIALGDETGFNVTNGSYNIYIGATGSIDESGVIRIGTPGLQTTTCLTGSVGIGTSTPVNALDVRGSADFLNSVGIGVATPDNLLDVRGSADFTGSVSIGGTAGSYGALQIDVAAGNQPGYKTVAYLTTTGVNIYDGLGSGPVSIYAAGAVLGNEFVAFSDERIKKIQGQSDGAADLKSLLGIQITDYTYIDTIAKGKRSHKKVIAQQVEKVFPQAVFQSTNVVPDIYQRATVKDGWVQLATNLKIGERVKLIGAMEQGIYPVREVRDGAFRTDFMPKTDEVFVFGREVGDFRNVDYEALSMLNVSATQELARKVEALQSKLNQAVAEKETLQKRLAALEARDQEREARLARIESSLEKVSAQASYAALNRK